MLTPFLFFKNSYDHAGRFMPLDNWLEPQSMESAVFLMDDRE
jgi:hypothetical protein